SFPFSNPNGFLPSFAVDGDATTFSHTGWLSEPQPWWQVDLGSSASIQTVQVWPRADRYFGYCGACERQLSDFYVFVSDTPFTSGNLAATLAQPGVSSYFTAGPAGTPTTLTVNRTGRYV